MATATIVKVTRTADMVELTATVAGDGPLGAPVEYVGRTPRLNDDGTAKPVAQLRTELTAALKAQRDAQHPTSQDLTPSFPGTITV